MISIQECREALGSDGEGMTDRQIAVVRAKMYALSRELIRWRGEMASRPRNVIQLRRQTA